MLEKFFVDQIVLVEGQELVDQAATLERHPEQIVRGPNSSASAESSEKSARPKKARNKLNRGIDREKPLPMMGNSSDPFLFVCAICLFLFALWFL